VKIEKYDRSQFTMKITPRQGGGSNAERQAAFRERHGDKYRTQNAARMRKTRKDHIPLFVGVDSEGIGDGKNHRAVLLGVGSAQYVARDKRRGLQYDEVFDFLYSEFLNYPEDTAFVGFYLGYDFNQWLRSLPQDKAFLLLTTAGRESRKRKNPRSNPRPYFPVRVGGWEVDMLAFKSLSIRPRACTCLEDGIPCMHPSAPWMTICDAGSFFQTSFLKVLEDWPEARTEKEFQLIKAGKEKRASARLNKEMKTYNALENDLLARVMKVYAEGLRDVGVKLKRDQWYGPGAVAQTWLRKNGAIKNHDIKEIPGMTDWLDVCQASFYGGWFEIFSHGIIKGETYNYDINSAYPFAATKLPHICEQCGTRRGKGNPKNRSPFMLLHCTVRTKGNRIGAVPYRTKNGSIIRPNISKGWYWQHELDAARRAGLVKEIEIHEWREFVPCDHPDPFAGIRDLYYQRQKVGKDTPLGKAIKLVINSIYGKFAQHVGSAPYNNWFYASYITAHCRAQILDAIATIPGKASSVLMVATDGICFDKPHPSLPVSKAKRLGEWDASVYHDVVLFKPGVYWHREGKAELKIKSRGVPAREFAEGINDIEGMFQVVIDKKCHPGSPFVRSWVENNLCPPIPDNPFEWDGPHKWLGPNGWPQYVVNLPFHMTSCKQALARGKWHIAGETQEDMPLVQSSDPSTKRGDVKWSSSRARLDSVIKETPPKELETKYYLDPTIVYPRKKDLGFGFFNAPINDIIEAVSTARDKASRYDIDIDGEYEWVTVWDGGPV
jgi:DNA polymerase type B, organellar and viral